MNICFDTYGCRLNRAEALEDEARCQAAGHRIVRYHQEADLIVVRGCSVTSKAQHECEKVLEHLRKKYPMKRIHVCGCLKNASPLAFEQPDPVPPVPTSTARAYLKAQDGCSGECSFCIVPQFRGTSISEDFTSLIDKAKRFIDAGYTEIVLTGCNLSLYASQGRRLPELVSALAELSPDTCRIRLGSLEPFLAARETVEAMAAHRNVCRYLHLPVQSGSNRILERMKRPYTVEEVEALMERARALMPSVALGCDMIAGFPGETERDHLDSQSLLQRQKIVKVHSFPFSRRPDTLAATMPCQLPHEKIKARAGELADIGKANRRAFARQFVGRTVEVVIEDVEKAAGWTGEHLWFEQLDAAGTKPLERLARREKARFVVRKADDTHLLGARG